MERSLLKHRKIGLLFLLGVGIPSFLLGYLAFRGIRNEVALEDQRRMGEYREVSRLAAQFLEDQLSALEGTVERSLQGLDSVPPGVLRQRSTELRAGNRLIQAIFRLDARGAVEFFSPNPLYFSEGSFPPPVGLAWPVAAADDLQLARRHEFQEQRFAAAEAAYRQALGAVSDSALRGEALLAIARVQRKAERLQAALGTCATLAEGYSGIRTTQGVPLGPVAHLERASLLLALGDSGTAVNVFRDLLQRLLEGDWDLEKGQYEFLVSQAFGGIRNLAAAMPEGAAREEVIGVLSDLEGREARRRGETDRLLLFSEAAFRLAREGEDGVGIPGESSKGRATLEEQGQTFLTLFPPRLNTGPDHLGVLLDSSTLADLLGQSVKDHLDEASSTWRVLGRSGQTVLSSSDSASGPVTLNATFPENFPPWLIEIYQKPRSPYRVFFASNQSIFFYMFLLIASILAFGLILTVRAMGHELELARLKSDFVSTVSHEFKSPLTSIRHVAEMLQAGSVASEERRQRYYEVLVEQSNRLSSLVTNILDLARIEEGKKDYHFEPTHLEDLTREVVEAARQRVGHQGFVVESRVEGPLPTVQADPAALTQAVSNLLENAIKFSGDARRVMVAVSAGREWATIDVVDHGLGVPPGEVDKIFDRFYRVGDPLTRSVKGSGLGLTLVKEIALAHGGQVRVESTPGKGSTFSIDLPVLPE